MAKGPKPKWSRALMRRALQACLAGEKTPTSQARSRNWPERTFWRKWKQAKEQNPTFLARYIESVDGFDDVNFPGMY